MGTTHEPASGDATHHLAHDWDDETTVGERIVAAVAEYEGEPPSSLPPLGRHIDPAALETLFDTADRDVSNGCVTFSYYGYTVVVRSTGQVLIRR